jgi:hypothetical protein
MHHTDFIKFLHSKQCHQSKPHYWLGNRARSLLRPLIFIGSTHARFPFFLAKFGDYGRDVALCISANTKLWRKQQKNASSWTIESYYCTFIGFCCMYVPKRTRTQQEMTCSTETCCTIPKMSIILEDQGIVMSYHLWMVSDQGLLFIDHH